MKKGKQAGRFWLMAFPLPAGAATDSNAEQVDEAKWRLFNTLQGKLFEAVGGNVEYHPIDMPQLKIGTLDGLMTASSELERLDPQLDSILGTLVASYRSLLPDESDFCFEVHGKQPEAFVEGFSFNLARYRADARLADLVAEIVNEATQIDALVKAKVSGYAEARTALSAIHRRAKGNLVARDLDGILEEHPHAAVQSDYLTTVYIIVPRSDTGALKHDYLHLAPMIVPDSFTEITRDDDHAVYALTIFRKHVKDLRDAVKSRKWVLKEHEQGTTGDREKAKEQARRMQDDAQGLHANLVRLLKTNLAEVFSCCVHIKFIRCFVEAALRYGLPPHYLTMTAHVKKESKRTERRLLRAMVTLLEQLDLPGISKLDLVAFGQISADHDAEGTGGEEAELWSALNAGGLMDDAPFVRIVLEW